MLIDATLVKNAIDAMGATLTLAQGMTQSFTWADLFLVVALVFLEAALSADNAVALAALVKHLPTPQQQNRALRWGIIGATAFASPLSFQRFGWWSIRPPNSWGPVICSGWPGSTFGARKKAQNRTSPATPIFRRPW